MTMRTIRHPTTGRSGFTLIELLLVVVVIGILAAVAVLRSRAMAQRAYQVTLEADLKMLATQQELFHHPNLRYAGLAELVDFEASQGVTVALNWVNGTGFAATATHAGLPGTECGYYVGDAAPPGSAGPASEEARITCN
jgi:prepilin-type N-terminal cleavage/methylation domain-containing protein